jgi:biopolymer transport protein ExbB
MLQHTPRQRRRLISLFALVVVLIAAVSLVQPSVRAQQGSEDPAGPSGQPTEVTVPEGVDADQPLDPSTEAVPIREEIEGINLFELILSGGKLMLPILLMSLLVATFSIERAIALRRDKIIPEELVVQLGQLGGEKGGFDPRQAYRLCQQFPSSASNVIRAMLLKVGRPHSEVEHAVAEASEREADRVYANVRWLNLAAAVTPLLGLLGTVWGMIRAFHDTTKLAPGQNKADYLAAGIYVALVTTLAGLSVAIPAAILAHYFEGRVTKMFHQIDELLFNLLPQIERYEGRVRFSQKGSEEDVVAAASGSQATPPPAPAQAN